MTHRLAANDDVYSHALQHTAHAGRPMGRHVVTTSHAASSTTWHSQSDAILLKALIEKLLAQEWTRVMRDEIKPDSYRMTKTRLEGFIYAYFANQQLQLINADTMEEFVNYLGQQKLSGPTIKGYLAVCLKLLRFLHRQRVIAQIPLLPAIKAQYKPRGAFTLTEYRHIVRRARELEGEPYTAWGPGKKYGSRTCTKPCPVR